MKATSGDLQIVISYPEWPPLIAGWRSLIGLSNVSSVNNSLHADQGGIEPLVSCIMIFFNAHIHSFFEEAIESVIAQSYSSWELLLVDDGSTDDSAEIAARYIREYPQRMKYLRFDDAQNRGMSAARNLGIEHAHGEFIAFLDADDIWLPEKLMQQVHLATIWPDAAMIYGRTKFWRSWVDDSHHVVSELESMQGPDELTITSKYFDRIVSPPVQLIDHIKDGCIYPCISSVLIRREILEQVGGFDNSFPAAQEDQVCFAKIFLNWPVYVSGLCWDLYRIHPDSFWRKAERRGQARTIWLKARIKYLRWLQEYMVEKQLHFKNINNTIRRERMVCQFKYVGLMLLHSTGLFDITRFLYRRIRN